MRSKEEAVKELNQMLKDGTPLRDLVVKDVIAEHDELVLVRDMHLVEMDGRLYSAVHYEVWYSRLQFEAGNYAPEDGSIPFTGYTVSDEQRMLETFKQICEVKSR
jgi:hypothetical protein